MFSFFLSSFTLSSECNKCQQNKAGLTELSEQHTCEAQKWTSTYIICRVHSHKDTTTSSHYDDNTHILNTSITFVQPIHSYTLPFLLLASFHFIKPYLNEWLFHAGRWLEKEGGGVLFMIWLWLFMMGTTICALNNYRMILKASNGRIFFPEISIERRGQQNKQQLRDYNKAYALQGTWMTA